jgi:hypothetical protein
MPVHFAGFGFASVSWHDSPWVSLWATVPATEATSHSQGMAVYGSSMSESLQLFRLCLRCALACLNHLWLGYLLLSSLLILTAPV